MPNTRFIQCVLTLKRNENSDPQEHAQHSPLGRTEVVQTLREVKKKEKALAKIEKPETKNGKKSQKKALTPTERPITIQIHQRQKRRRRKQNNGKTTKIEEKLLRTKYSDKGPALFGSVKILTNTTNREIKLNISFIPNLLTENNFHPKNAATQGHSLRYRQNLGIRSGLC